MIYISPKDNPFGFLRAQFNNSSLKHNDLDLFHYSGQTITHYTDLHGLYGIVESGSFWLSDHRFLNDSEEFENGRKLTIDLLKLLSEKSNYASFKSILLETIKELEIYNEKPYYVASFSKKPDSLDQWRSYASNGNGISITFDNTRKSLSHFFAMPILSACKVVYSDKEKIKIILKTIRKYKKEHDIDINYGNKVNVDFWSEELSRFLALEFINFKHSEYSSEQEIRIAVSSSHLKHFKKIQHRVNNDRIIPFISTSDIYDEKFIELIGTDKLPITEVRIGPKNNQDITARSIKEYLRNKEYSNVKVVKSNVPYRG